ncbi:MULTISPECIES: AraC family transcriptional regulator [Rhodomicrobium]|uniref:helix-turn-helix domain-containing protein n=1 Tax=Rhodomicrobium TaxID=1068 RepID=UPI000B4A8F30|nr:MULTISPECIES: AraC family transcriptional regulator [Rhodomicrobium]
MSIIPTQTKAIAFSHPVSDIIAESPSTSGSDKDVVGELLAEALAILDRDSGTARRYIESAQRLLRASVTEHRPKTGHLADWQVRRAKTFIRDNLESSLRVKTVAQLVHLSASYFSRSFKATTGISYSEFVATERINLAKRLLLTTDAPISEVALICGLADQSHLTRLFSRAVGLPPDAWRRQVLGSTRFPRRRSAQRRVYRHCANNAGNGFLTKPQIAGPLRPR